MVFKLLATGFSLAVPMAYLEVKNDNTQIQSLPTSLISESFSLCITVRLFSSCYLRLIPYVNEVMITPRKRTRARTSFTTGILQYTYNVCRYSYIPVHVYMIYE